MNADAIGDWGMTGGNGSADDKYRGLFDPTTRQTSPHCTSQL